MLYRKTARLRHTLQPVGTLCPGQWCLGSGNEFFRHFWHEMSRDHCVFRGKNKKIVFWRSAHSRSTASAAATTGQSTSPGSGEGVPARSRAGEGGIMVRWSCQNTKNHDPAACGGGAAAASRGIGAGPACAPPATRPACVGVSAGCLWSRGARDRDGICMVWGRWLRSRDWLRAGASRLGVEVGMKF